MGQQREHPGHNHAAMIRIREAREKYEQRKSGRVKQTYRIVGTDANGDPIGVWDHEKEAAGVSDMGASISEGAKAGLSA